MIKKMGLKRIKNRPKDNCEVCLGEKGGVPGNENIHHISVNGTSLKYTIKVCDYCHSKWFS